MTRRAWTIAVLTLTSLALACAPGFADEGPLGFRLWRCWTRTSFCPSLCGSPDDYCRKPYPAICSVSRCGGVDDYCRKAMPCLIDVPRCGEADDYCRKSIPCLLCPPATPYLHYDCAEPSCTTGKRR